MKKRGRISYYQGRDKLWYWQLRAGNSQIIATGAEGYASRRNARRAVSAVLRVIVKIIINGKGGTP
jgi:uncharacterized protein YegP (UPF0339 family)